VSIVLGITLFTPVPCCCGVGTKLSLVVSISAVSYIVDCPKMHSRLAGTALPFLHFFLLLLLVIIGVLLCRALDTSVYVLSS
jgi:hypothetical protein